MSYAERARRKALRRGYVPKMDPDSGWSLHAFGACQTGCLYCYTERALAAGTVRIITTEINPLGR